MRSWHRALALTVWMVMLTVSWDAGVTAQPMIADIREDVVTPFGTYHPYPANFFPNVSPFTVAPDFSNVVNFSDVKWWFDATDTTLLLQNHFTVTRSPFQQLYDVYNYCTWDASPVFVTTDAVLHTYHVLFDCLLAEIEVRQFVRTLEGLTDALIDGTESLSMGSTEPLTQEALRRNLAYFYVGKKLLRGVGVTVPESIDELVNAELALIANHDGYHYSPILGEFSKLDYSQFQPRGHYTKNDTLEAYFQTVMWYGWTIFTMEPELFGELASRHTLQALLLVQLLYTLESEGRSLVDWWSSLYEPTVFFVGKTDDPNVIDYKEIGDLIYGHDFLVLSPDNLADTSLLNAFMAEAQQLPEPAIPNWIYMTYIQYTGFRFMGQRFIPDSYMFAHLVYPYVGTLDHQRWMPKGLDIMAILGSERAYTLLDSVYDETSYANYSEQLFEFHAEFSDKPSEEWAQNLYWNWLYCLMPLLYEKDSGYPFFMQTLAWADKELLTALASWAELRHDTILYAKQSTSPCGLCPGPPKSYVEPNPHVYARLASLVRYTRDGLQSRDFLQEGFQEKLDLFETLLLFLRDVSIKELEDVPLSDAEYENIFCFGRIMQYLVSDSDDPQQLWNANVDDMAVVADVHTDSNTDRCLEEGVGYPLEIFVIVHEGGVTRITKGAIFSYYEFGQPIEDRLTDEIWREMLTGGTPPALPEWVSGFANTSAPPAEFPVESPANLYSHEFMVVEEDEDNFIPATLRLLQNYPNPFNAFTDIGYQIVNDRYPSRTTLVVYNILGQEVHILVDEVQETGYYTVTWDGRDKSGERVASGVYLCRLNVGEFSQTRKMVLLQ
jgi:hypothetical protein